MAKKTARKLWHVPLGNNVIVARKGTMIHGKVTKSEKAKRLTGKSELQLALSDIVPGKRENQVRR